MQGSYNHVVFHNDGNMLPWLYTMQESSLFATYYTPLLMALLPQGNNSANIHALTMREPETSSNPSSSPPTSPTSTEHLVSVDNHGSSICSKGASSTLAASLPDDEDLRFVTFEEVYLCAKDDKLHPTMRAKYVDLMLGQ